MNALKLKKLYGDDLTRYGFNETSTMTELGSWLMHIHNMGGVDPEDLDDVIAYAEDPEKFEELRAVMFD